MKESEILKTLFGKLVPPEDDCYYLKPGRLVTTDSLSEGTHFLHEWSSPEDLAIKLIEVNVSDISASGGVPDYCFLNLGLSKISQKRTWVERFSKTLRKKLRDYKMSLVGGDTFYSQTTTLSLTVLGRVKKPWLRSGGKHGDNLYVTGNLGLSELGFQTLKQNKEKKSQNEAIKKHLQPKSRANLVKHLLGYKINACMDITDGLVQDAERLCLASKGKLRIRIEDIPLHPAAKLEIGISGCITSGEELELLFLSNEELPKKIVNVPIHKIGNFQKGKPGLQFLENGAEFFPHAKGFLHFSEE
ncbi:thiamine-phosphate kinase [Leptospira sp. 96542]|nr:thiamine-phosphate kinase [Leptospira sp. 96542]